MLTLMKATTERAPGKHWRWFGTAQDEAQTFLNLGAQRQGAGAHGSEMVTLVVGEEKNAADLARFPRKMTLRSFVKDHIWQIDETRSKLGSCGR